MKPVIIGIDPGVAENSKGAIAIITPDGAIAIQDLPGLNEEKSLSAIVSPFLHLSCIGRIEDQTIWWGDIQKGSVWRVLSLIKHQQMCVSVLQTLGIPVECVPAAKWKRSSGLTGESKDASIAQLIALYPECRHSLIYKAPRSVKRNHNRADAGLIAHSLLCDMENGEAIA
jgi:hypothetical protein